jgi:hypothetical protein
MVRVREARRLYRRFHAECFCSFDPDYRVESSDIAWVVQQLRKHGGRAAWEAAEKLRQGFVHPRAASDAVPHFGRPGGVLPRVVGT